MRRTSRLLILMMFGIIFPAASQQIGDSYRIEVDHRPTIREQLDLGRQLVREARMIVDPQERMIAVGVAAAHLEDVRLRWPDEKRAVVISKLVQADLYSSTGLTANAVEALESVLEMSEEFPEHMQVLRALGREKAALGRGGEAKALFDRLEEMASLERGPITERSAVLAEIAMSYRWLRMFEESAIRFEKAASLPGIDEIREMVWLAAATEDWLAVKNPERAKASLARLEASFYRFSGQPVRDYGDARARSDFSQTISALRSQLGEQGQ